MNAFGIASAAGLLVLVFPALGQITAIEGDVKGADGKLIQGAVIKIVRTDIMGNYQVKSDEKGHYFYNGLPIGTYNLSCEIDGKLVDQMNGVRTRPGDPNPVSFDARKALASGPTGRSSLPPPVDPGEKMRQNERLANLRALADAAQAGADAVRTKQFDLAVAAFTKITQLRPDFASAWWDLGYAYSRFANTKTGSERDEVIQQSIEAYAKAVSLNPGDARFHTEYGMALARKQRFDEAAAELNKALSLDPSRAGEFRLKLGMVMLVQGQKEEALESFKLASEAGDLEAHYFYGISLLGRSSVDANGKVRFAPGTLDVLEKYVHLSAQGTGLPASPQNVQQACAVLRLNQPSNPDCQDLLSRRLPAIALPAQDTISVGERALAAGTPAGDPVAGRERTGESPGNIREEVERVLLSGNYQPLTDITPDTGASVQPSMATLMIRNNGADSATVLFRGPSDRRVQVAPGASLSVDLPPGTYAIVGRIEATKAQLSYGDATLEAKKYSLIFTGN